MAEYGKNEMDVLKGMFPILLDIPQACNAYKVELIMCLNAFKNTLYFT